MGGENTPKTEPAGGKSRLGMKVLKVVAIASVVIALLMVWWVKHNLYASAFTPTELNSKERAVLQYKLERLEKAAQKEHVVRKKWRFDPSTALKPEPYSEKNARREISLTEKEINALIANNPEVAQRVAIDLADDLVSIKLVLPVDEEVPVLGGKTLRIHVGITLAYEEGRPVVALKGVSLGGIPLPNAWLGYLKGVNLVDEFGDEGGFWALFSEGVEDLEVEEGHIQVKLKE